MGKGDKKTKRGKIVIGSYGKRRPRKDKPTMAAPAAKPKAEVKPKVKAKAEPKVESKPKAKPEPKEAAKPKKTTKKKVDE
ncbi:MAG: 30S ribosomal protein THX [Bacteroidales bacterium]|jgi:ribosomal small subunit protein bTHX|nr:30S ribosomal protein THX [Bacteroidales bacterium]